MEFFKYVKQEIAVIKDRDPAIKSTMEVFLYPSFHAILKYRKAHKLYLKKHYYRARRISQKTARKTGIEIHPGAQIGEGLFIDHGHGRRGSHIDDDDRSRVFADRGNGVYDHIASYSLRVIHDDVHAGFDTSADQHGMIT